MPLPVPRKREHKDNFISRCMRSAVIQREYASQKQQLAVCFSQIRRVKRGSAKRRKSALPKKRTKK